METPKKYSWSYSALSMYKMCPKKYYHLKVVKDVEEPQTEALTFGNRVHKVAEDHLKENVSLPEELSYLGGMLAKLKEIQGDRLCEYRMGLTRDLEPCGFFDKDVWYRGVIDLLIVDGDTAVIVDYKTGKNPAYADTKQLEIMSLAVFSHFPDVKTIKSALLFLVNPALIKADFDREDKTELWAKWYGDVAQLKSCYESNSKFYSI